MRPRWKKRDAPTLAAYGILRPYRSPIRGTMRQPIAQPSRYIEPMSPIFHEGSQIRCKRSTQLIRERVDNQSTDMRLGSFGC